MISSDFRVQHLWFTEDQFLASSAGYNSSNDECITVSGLKAQYSFLPRKARWHLRKLKYVQSTKK